MGLAGMTPIDTSRESTWVQYFLTHSSIQVHYFGLARDLEYQ